MNMVSPCKDASHHLYFDKYYTLLAVIADQAIKHFGACPAHSVNRRAVPQAIQKAKLIVGMAHQNDVLNVSWFNKRQVNLATNLHDDSMFTKQLHERSDDHLWQVQ